MCSGDEDNDEETLDWLPIAPEIEDPEEAGWGHLEVRIITYYYHIRRKYVWQLNDGK